MLSLCFLYKLFPLRWEQDKLATHMSDCVGYRLSFATWDSLFTCSSGLAGSLVWGFCMLDKWCSLALKYHIICLILLCSRCNKISSMGVLELVQHCRSLETLRCGGCPSSESTARRSLSIFKPNLSNVEGETWEEIDTSEIGHGGQSLRWLVWVCIVPLTD
jgi:hypothetical protein